MLLIAVELVRLQNGTLALQAGRQALEHLLCFFPLYLFLRNGCERKYGKGFAEKNSTRSKAGQGTIESRSQHRSKSTSHR